MTGTLVNAGAVIVGGLAGILIRSKLPQKIVDIVFQAIGLVTATIGISMALRMENLILAVVSLVLGGVIGQWIDIDMYLRRLTDYIQRKVKGDKNNTDTDDSPGVQGGATTASNRFTEGFVTASMIFCVGSMAILGAMEEGLGQSPNLLLTKSMIDGITSIILGASFGAGVIFSSVPIILYQGGLTFLTVFLMRFMNDTIINDMTGVGGILLIGLGIKLLNIKDINVVNLLPSLIVIALLSYFFA